MKIFLGVFYLLFALMPAHALSNELDKDLQKPQKSPAERLAAFQARQAERRIWQKADIDAGRKSFEAKKALHAAGQAPHAKEN